MDRRDADLQQLGEDALQAGRVVRHRVTGAHRVQEQMGGRLADEPGQLAGGRMAVEPAEGRVRTVAGDPEPLEGPRAGDPEVAVGPQEADDAPDRTLLDEAARLAVESPSPALIAPLSKVDPFRQKTYGGSEETAALLTRIAKMLLK